MDALSATLLAKAVADITDARNAVELLDRFLKPMTRPEIVQRLNQALIRIAVVEDRISGQTTVKPVER